MKLSQCGESKRSAGRSRPKTGRMKDGWCIIVLGGRLSGLPGLSETDIVGWFESDLEKYGPSLEHFSVLTSIVVSLDASRALSSKVGLLG